MASRNKKVAITIFGLLFLVIIAAASYKVFLRPTVVSPISDSTLPTPTIVEPLTLWQDQSEFSFKYPMSLQLNPHEEDKDNYAHVELSSATHSGNIVVWAQDTKSTDNDDWIKAEKIQGAIDTTLASLPAKKFLSGDNPKILTTVVIRNGYLYKIETKLEEADFWNKVYDTVSSAFTFTSDSSDKTAEKTSKPQIQEPVSEEPAEEFDEVVE